MIPSFAILFARLDPEKAIETVVWQNEKLRKRNLNMRGTLSPSHSLIKGQMKRSFS